MQKKTVDETAKQDLVNRLGKPFAESIIQHLESKGKDIEDKGVAWKMPNMPEDDEGEDMEDDKGDNKKPDSMKSLDLSEKDMMVFQGMKQLGDFMQAMHKTQDDLRKQVKDLSNQLEQMKDGQGNQTDTMRRMTQYFGQLTQQQPASKSKQTQYNGDDANIQEVLNKNHEQEPKPAPVFEQWKSNGNIEVPDYPFTTFTDKPSGNQ